MAEKEKLKRKRTRGFWSRIPGHFHYEETGRASEIAALIQSFQGQLWGTSRLSVTLTEIEPEHSYAFEIVATKKHQKDMTWVVIRGRIAAISKHEFAIDGRSFFFPGMMAVTGLAVSILAPLANALFFQGSISSCWGISIVLFMLTLPLILLGWLDYRECVNRFRQILTESSRHIARLRQDFPRAPAWYELLDKPTQPSASNRPDESR